MVNDPLPGWKLVMAYFGDPWSSDVCEVGKRAETPTGAECWLCKDLVIFGHQGMWITQFSKRQQRDAAVPVHRECLLLKTMGGGVDHQEHRCPHYGGPVDDRPYRQQAMELWRWMDVRHFQTPTQVH